jgi:hypothetical protein
MYWYEPVRTLLDTRPYEKPQNGTYQYVPTLKIPMAVHTGMYWYVLPCTCTVQGGTRWYKMVQGGTRWYKQQYMEVHGGTSPYENRFNRTGWYVLACTDPYCSIWVYPECKAVQSLVPSCTSMYRRNPGIQDFWVLHCTALYRHVSSNGERWHW